MNFEKLEAWSKDAEPLELHSVLEPGGPKLVVEKPWPQKVVMTGVLLELRDLGFITNTLGEYRMGDVDETVKITAHNGWAVYKVVASAKRMIGVNIDLYGLELIESNWEAPSAVP